MFKLLLKQFYIICVVDLLIFVKNIQQKSFIRKKFISACSTVCVIDSNQS